MSLGMDAATGRTLTDMAHLRQSIAQILATPVGTRVARRPFGSLLAALLDAPASEATRIQLYAATATALMQFEPRLSVTRVQVQPEAARAGRVALHIEGQAYLNGRTRAVSLSVPHWQGAAPSVQGD